MPKSKLESAIQKAASDFALTIVEAVKNSTLDELLALQGKTPKRRGRKPGPKTKAKKKPGLKPRKKVGRSPKAKTAAKKKPGPKPKKKAVSTRKAAKKAKKRLSSSEKVKVLDRIVDYLKKNPGSKTPAIAKTMGIPSRRAGLYLKELRDKKRVTAKGEKVNMVYSVKK